MRAKKENKQVYTTSTDHDMRLAEITRIQKRNRKNLEKRENEKRAEEAGKLSPSIIACILVNFILLMSIMIADLETFRIMLMLLIWEVIIISINKDRLPISDFFLNKKKYVLSVVVYSSFYC